MWTVRVFNPTVQLQEDLVITDLVPSVLLIEDVTTSRGVINQTGQMITITLPTLAPLDDVEITIRTRVRDINREAIVLNEACLFQGESESLNCAQAQVNRITVLPITGETPWWRTRVLWLVMSMSLMGLIGAYQLQKKWRS